MIRRVAGTGRTSSIVLLGLAAVLVAVFLVSSDGFFTLDEVIYYMGAEAMRATHGFAVSNGYDLLPLEPLRMWFLVDGPNGLVPQYPIGTAVVGGPMLALFGQSGLILVNLLAGIGTLFAGHILARRLFGSVRAADVSVMLLTAATFWVEYVVGYWPHSVSDFATTAGLALALTAVDREVRAWVPALWSGLIVGAGMLFRLDGILVLPVILAAAILVARNVLGVIGGGAVGLLPMVGVLAWSNHVKFGTWNPLSYGSTGGATKVTLYLGLGAVILVALAALAAVRILRDRDRRPERVVLIAVAVAIAAAAMSPAGHILWRLLHGAWALAVSTSVLDGTIVTPGPHGTTLFGGLPKKALGQSMPWLGLLLLLAGPKWRAGQGRGVAVVLLLSAVWIAPFASRSWYGGFGSNMRYFLPILPPLCALEAWLLVGLARRLPDTPRVTFGLGAVAAVAAFAVSKMSHDLIPVLHQTVSTRLLLLLASLALLAALTDRTVALRAVQICLAAALGLSVFLAYDDYRISQSRRVAMAGWSQTAARVPGKVVFLAPPESVAEAVTNPDHLMTMPHLPSLEYSPEDFRPACDAGYRVLTDPASADLCNSVTGATGN